MALARHIPWAKPEFWGNEKRYVLEALDSTWISGGPFVDRLEREVAGRTGVSHALAVCNGTAALHMAFLAHRVGEGDEVIVPGFAFMAAANVALQLRAKPVFAEVHPETWCMTAADIEPLLTSKTKLIVPIHTYGNVCPMTDILSLSRAKGVAVVEDAAEAFLSRCKGRFAGAMGSIGTFSFHATKTITTGEGGMAITDDDHLHQAMHVYRNHGMLRKTYYWHELAGHNFRMTNLQAALGCAQIESAEQILRERKRVHAQYGLHLSGGDGITPQHFEPDVEPVLWAMAVRLDDRAYPQGRDAVMEALKRLQIETRPGFYAASMMDFYGSPRLPLCEELSRQVISLPSYASLRDDQIEYICSHLKGLRA